MIGWTDDFSEFKEKVEQCFGNLERLASDEPDLYAHMVLAHGFMEYAGVKGLHERIKSDIASKYGAYDASNKLHSRYYWARLRKDYYLWAEENNLPKGLLEFGWNEYLND